MTHDQLISILQLCSPEVNSLTSLEITPSMMAFISTNGLAPWIYYRLQQLKVVDVVSAEVYDELRKAFMHTMVRNQQLKSVYAEVAAILHENGIDIVALKGFGLAYTVYPDEALRPMGDIDLLVKEGCAVEARQILLNHGAVERYIPRSLLHDQVHAHVSAITFKGVLVEIHQRLYALGNPLNPDGTMVFEHRRQVDVGSVSVGVLSDQWFVYHLATHALHGYHLGGMRMGWLVDMALMLNRHQLDVTSFIEQVAELNVRVKDDVRMVLNWALMLLKPELISNELLLNFPGYESFAQPGKIKQQHRMQNIDEIFHAPGLITKFHLLFKELFPDNRYLVFRYGVGGIRGWLKRYFFRRDK